MDRGEILMRGFRVLPANNGSFVVRSDDDYSSPTPGRIWGFSSVDHLLSWLSDEAVAMKSALADAANTTSTHDAIAPELVDHADVIGKALQSR